LVSHEMMHLELKNTHKKQSERTCDAYGISKVRTWRKIHNLLIFPP
jgi:hypothetical protein